MVVRGGSMVVPRRRHAARASTCGRRCTSTEAGRTWCIAARCTSRTSRISASIGRTRGPTPIRSRPTPSGRHRYADGRVTPDGSRCSASASATRTTGRRERARGRAARRVGDVRTIAGGRDFYSAPRISPDGTKLAWLSWDLPWMPWDGCELWVGDLGADGEVSNARRVAGTDGEEVDLSSPSGARRARCTSSAIARGGGTCTGSDDGRGHAAAPGGDGVRPDRCGSSAPRTSRSSTTVGSPASSSVTACSISAMLDPVSGELLDLDLPYTAFDYPCVARGGVAARRSSAAARRSRRRSSPSTSPRAAVEVLRESVEHRRSIRRSSRRPGRSSSRPRADSPRSRITTRRPTRTFVAPDGERPPLIVMSHGGPTSESNAEFDLGDAVLHQPRVRRRRRELRRQHRLRAGVPAAVERELGRRRHDGLHQRGPVPRRTRARPTATGS